MLKLLVIVITAITAMSGNCYTQTAEVVAIEEDSTVVVVDYATGNEWAYYGDAEIGEVVTMLMDSNGTECVEDDIILYTK